MRVCMNLLIDTMTAKIALVVVVVVVGSAGGQEGSHRAIPHPPPPLPTHLDPSTCPPTYDKHPLVLVSLDGFNVEYLRRGITPTIQLMRERGVSAPYMKPSYPTITFPNHYTIVTGLYPAAHGIVANKFYDPTYDAVFRVGREESFKKRWWGGEAIWSTLKRQGKKSATFFWPGSEVDGYHPTYWYYYNQSIPLTHRVGQVLEWLELPPASRPSFITLYMHDPDSTGHDFGPHSPQMNSKLMELDGIISQLITGLSTRGLLPCVNIIVLADHGMAQAGDAKLINLSEYLPSLPEQARLWGGGYASFTPHDSNSETKEAMMRALTCKREEMRVYERELLPVRWHMGAQRRVEEVVVEVDPGYTVGGDAAFTPDEGEHGYDYLFPSMNALFLAYGPSFALGKEVEAFQNIELYNLMCQVLDVTPASNNGTWGSLHHLLAHPPSPPPPLPVVLPPISKVPERDLTTLLRPSQCEGDMGGVWEGVDMLREGEGQADDLIKFHAPWGTPQHLVDDAVLLVQPDHITAYSPRVRLPLWTSFGINSVRGKVNGAGQEWRSDPRIDINDAPSCSAYDSVKGLNVTRQPLFPPEFSCKGCEDLPYLMTNALPLTAQVKGHWRSLLHLVARWLVVHGPLNVVTGPAMDYNSDSKADDVASLGGGGGDLVVPTHIFLVVTRCVAPVVDLTSCPPHMLDSESFIFPQYIPVTNCLSSERYMQEYSAKASDVEGLAGLVLYPGLHHYHRVTLTTRIHSNVWGRETWENRLLDNFLYP